MKDLTKEINEFRDKRNWRQYHNPKDLSLALSLVASELLEYIQWISGDEGVRENFQNIKE